MMSKVEERTPYVIVAFQECERMNVLMNEIRRSLRELQLGLKVSTKFTKYLHKRNLVVLHIHEFNNLYNKI